MALGSFVDAGYELDMHPTKLTDEQLMAIIQNTIEEAPPFENYQVPLTEPEMRWLGRAEAVIEASGSMANQLDFRVARKSLGTYNHNRTALLEPLINVYYQVELRAPIASQGKFIPPGDTWNGYAALVKLVQQPCQHLLLVDPYLNATVFTDLLPHAEAKILVGCLTSQRAEYHAGLSAAATKWANDPIGKAKPVETRYAPQGSLHDRLVIIDREVWLISQSFKDIGKKSAASVAQAEKELGLMKSQHYADLWMQSAPICTTTEPN